MAGAGREPARWMQQAEAAGKAQPLDGHDLQAGGGGGSKPGEGGGQTELVGLVLGGLGGADFGGGLGRGQAGGGENLLEDLAGMCVGVAQDDGGGEELGGGDGGPPRPGMPER